MPPWRAPCARDLKPDNILVKLVDSTSLNPSVADLMPHPIPFRIAKISDFGTTKIKHDSTAYSHQAIPIGTRYLWHWRLLICHLMLSRLEDSTA
jgi:serine/threonine protein kinase